MAENEAERIAKHTLGLRGVAALRVAVEEVLPVDEQRTLEQTTWLSFWSRAIGDEHLADEQRHSHGRWRSLLRRLFDEARADGEVAAGLDSKAEAQRLAALIDGFSVQSVLEPDRFPSTVLVSLVHGYLDAIVRASGSPGPALGRRRRERAS